MRRPKLTVEENVEVLTIVGRWNLGSTVVAIGAIGAFLVLPRGGPTWVVLVGGVGLAIAICLWGLYRALTRLRYLRVEAARREEGSGQEG
jgi:hypothetical protein